MNDYAGKSYLEPPSAESSVAGWLVVLAVELLFAAMVWSQL